MLQPKVMEVVPLADYKLSLTFETGEIKVFDVKPYISGDWFGQLMDVEYFNSVHVTERTIEWAGGQDIAPHELYDLSEPFSNDSWETIKSSRRKDLIERGRKNGRVLHVSEAFKQYPVENEDHKST